MMLFSRSGLTRLRQFLGLAEGELTGVESRPWFAFALLYATGCAVLALRLAFASEYLLADDVREHVFWMFRFVDHRLFPQDPIADYFQSLAPSGYATVYWLLARVGIDPLLASKVLPSVLSLFAAGYFFALTLRVFRSRAAATLAAMLFCQCLWLNSDLSSATPRAFFYPLFVAFLYFHVRGSIIGVLVTVGLEGIVFPPAALLSVGVLALDCLHWENGPRLVPGSRAYLVFAAAFGLILVCLWPYLHSVGAFGPLVTYAEARQMPEFGPDGRVPFFFPSLWGYWVGGNGGLHTPPTHPPWFFAAFLWPLLRRFSNQFPLLKAVPRGARPLSQIAGAALLLFVIAHLLLFHLYLPNRYTQPTTRVLLILAAGGVMLALVDAALLWAETRSERWLFVSAVGAIGLSAVLLGVVAAFPLLTRFPSSSYIKGTDPDLYHFFARQPATIRIASLSDEANNLPTFCRRSIIIGAECAVPFHPAYYLPLRERGLQLARAQYSADLSVVQQCVRDQRIDFWLLDRSAFSRNYWHQSRLLRQLSMSAPVQTLGAVHGVPPVLQQPPPGSVAFEDAKFVVLDARRLLALHTH
jgi:hypothetical protein